MYLPGTPSLVGNVIVRCIEMTAYFNMAGWKERFKMWNIHAFPVQVTFVLVSVYLVTVMSNKRRSVNAQRQSSS